ncbi:MAG TPA: histidine kinase, partial [Segetibacter sp.]
CRLKNGQPDSVIKYCDELLNNRDEKKLDYSLEQEFMHLKSLALIRSNLFEKAIGQGFQLLQKSEANKDTLMQIKAKNVIGWAYMELSQHRTAIDWLKKALATSNNDIYFDKYTAVYANIASNYNNISRFDSALFYINKALIAVERFNDLTAQANALNIKADVLINLHEIKPAEALLKQALDIRRRIGDPFYIVSDYFQLSVFYANNGEPRKGIETALKGIETAKLFNLTSKLPLLYTGLAESYKMAGDVTNYAKTLETIIVLKDSIYQKNSTENLAALQSSYEVQKNENIIIQQKLDILKRDYLVIAAVLVILLTVISGIYLYRKYRNRQSKKLNQILELQKQNEISAVSEAEENQRKRIAAELHDNMGAQISFITSNIDWILDAPKPLTDLEQMERLQLVYQTSQGLMLSLRETIWALSRDKISIEEFSDKLKSYIKAFIQLQPQLHFQSREELNLVIMLSPLLALNIFRIFQEGVNNAIKYAKASKLFLKITCSGKDFEI